MSAPSLLSLLFLLAIAGCGSAPADDTSGVEALDTQLIGHIRNGADDPTLIGALKDQIMVDPALVQQANADAVRPPTMPLSGAVPPDDIADAAMAKRPVDPAPLRSAPAASATCPECRAARRALTLGALAEHQGAAGDCAAKMSYSAGWANRLPQGVPLYPDAQVIEAAGADGAGCALRIVSFRSTAPLQRLLDYYYTKAGAAGYSAQHKAEDGQHMLAGTRKRGGAFMVLVKAREDGGSDVDLMADGGT